MFFTNSVSGYVNWFYALGGIERFLYRVFLGLCFFGGDGLSIYILIFFNPSDAAILVVPPFALAIFGFVSFFIINTHGFAAIRPTQSTPVDGPHFERFPAPVPLPASFTPTNRFKHQWVLGAHGSGKTTLLEHELLNDLKLVERDEATVFVMDSQNELVPQLARLKLFAPGQPLQGKLIYLEPDPEHPLALNIFDVRSERFNEAKPKDRAILERGALEMVEFFLSSVIKMDVSAHQDVMLKYLVPAVMSVPNATILTLRDLVEKGGYQKFALHFERLDGLHPVPRTPS